MQPSHSVKPSDSKALYQKALNKGPEYFKRVTINGKNYRLIIITNNEPSKIPSYFKIENIQGLADSIIKANEKTYPDLKLRTITRIDSKGVHFAAIGTGQEITIKLEKTFHEKWRQIQEELRVSIENENGDSRTDQETTPDRTGGQCQGRNQPSVILGGSNSEPVWAHDPNIEPIEDDFSNYSFTSIHTSKSCPQSATPPTGSNSEENFEDQSEIYKDTSTLYTFDELDSPEVEAWRPLHSSHLASIVDHNEGTQVGESDPNSTPVDPEDSSSSEKPNGSGKRGVQRMKSMFSQAVSNLVRPFTGTKVIPRYERLKQSVDE